MVCTNIFQCSTLGPPPWRGGAWREFFTPRFRRVISGIISMPGTTLACRSDDLYIPGMPTTMLCDCIYVGGGPRVVVSTAAFHARVRGSFCGRGGLKETKTFLPHPLVKLSIVGRLRDREVACLTSHL